MQENLIVNLIAFYSLDHLNKHFRSTGEKVRENAISSQNIKETIITQINSTLVFDVTITFDTKIVHCTFSTLHCESKCIIRTASSN